MMRRDAARFDFANSGAHIPRREKLALLDIHHAAGTRRRDQQVGLAREQRRDLQDIDDFRGRRGLRRFMDVGQDRQPGRVLDASEDAQAFVETGSAKALDTGAIRLVERRFEDDFKAGRARNRGDLFGVPQR